MEITWNDIQQAFADVRLEMTFTVGALVFLSLCGVLILILSTWLNRRASNPKPTPKQTPQRPIIGLRLRMRHSVWQSKSVSEPSSSWWANFWQGMSTEFFGAVVTTIFLGVIVLIVQQYQANQNLQAQEAQAIQNRKDELILQLGSDERVWAVEAARQLRQLGWLVDGTLQNASLRYADLTDADLAYADLTDVYLSGANLGGANLVAANLTGAALEDTNLTGGNLAFANLGGANLVAANLTDANLQEANLMGGNLAFANFTGANLVAANLTDTNLQYAILASANLRDANLTGATVLGANWLGVNLHYANLTGANLAEVNLTDADLMLANLTDANLQYANLTGAILWEANLTGANLHNATLDEKTVLPDAVALRSESGGYVRDENNHFLFARYWTSDTDMSRYTDPNHPNYWNPCVELTGFGRPRYCDNE